MSDSTVITGSFTSDVHKLNATILQELSVSYKLLLGIPWTVWVCTGKYDNGWEDEAWKGPHLRITWFYKIVQAHIHVNILPCT